MPMIRSGGSGFNNGLFYLSGWTRGYIDFEVGTTRFCNCN
ncbi:hypothetical protein Msil_2827 [Methylocella silvestris BL2]|uniref:Uncharacterized protein n=1 Tax=Methylocella silvestris (strain DSM 15510 / CIP 108128 / LMG 27833 / NCIMB 13906 / BL2) TaxID=395965 RepID=B8ETA3_METSB|nr:hypothetical protein Msil_2827 [Methylocella silvestris BL2]